MKIVFSRKGVDSAAGGCASALVEGRPIALPIPLEPSEVSYGDVAEPLRSLACDLSGGRLSGERRCHLDPDIDAASLADRPAGWRGAFGQIGSALGHLRNQGIGLGDLFLFWGRFRPVERGSQGWHYVGPVRHMLYGWLEVGEVLDLQADWRPALQRWPALARHPHLRDGWAGANRLFVAADRLSVRPDLAGSGVFRTACSLTEDGAALVTDWRVPAWLDPMQGGTGLSYHTPGQWQGDGRLRATAQGQEFVADAGDRADARAWLAALFEKAA